MEYILPRVLHIDSEVPSQPNFDTLVGVCNPYALAQAVEIHCYDLDGNEVPKSPLVRTLEPGRSFATTLIAKNIFPDPPQNFSGYGKIVFPGTPAGPGKDLPVAACIGGGGPSPRHWNYSSPNIPVLRALHFPFGKGKRYVFPYLIPHFRDAAQHDGEHEYRTGLSMTNVGNSAVWISMIYTVGDTYPNAGDQFSCAVTLDPGKTICKQMHEFIEPLLGFNSEGWLDIRTPEDSTLAMYLLCANRDFNFFGFGQSCWMIE